MHVHLGGHTGPMKQGARLVSPSVCDGPIPGPLLLVAINQSGYHVLKPRGEGDSPSFCLCVSGGKPSISASQLHHSAKTAWS